jgi:flagellar hook-associated protein 1
MSVGNVLSSGKKGLLASQFGLATTSHNVSNVNTEGFSRQRVELQTDVPQAVGGRHQLGTGVKIAAVTRAHSDFLARRTEKENGSLGQLESQADIYNQMDDLFKSDGETGISHSVSTFFNDLRSLSTQPESSALRSAVRESGTSLASTFKTVDESILAMSADLNRRVEGDVMELNHLTTQIASLGQRILEIEVTGGNANDERDARDLALNKLSKIVDIHVTPAEEGKIIVTSNRLGPLIVGAEPVQFSVSREGNTPIPGGFRINSIITSSGATKDVTDYVEGGSLGGFLKMRDQTLAVYRGKIDNLAFNLAQGINAIHREAYSRDGKVGNDFFAEPASEYNAAANLNLSDAVQRDLSAIATGDSPNANGDNRALLRMTDLQSKAIFDDGRANFSEYSASIAGSLGLEIKSNRERLDLQQGLVEQLDMYQEQISGVSLDEEALNMIKFQKAFDASAKVIQVADSMLDTVLNLKRF